MKSDFLRVFGSLLLLLPAVAQAGSYSITGIVSQTVDSNNPANAEIPQGSSGGPGNTTTWAAGEVGRFNLKDSFNNDFGLIVSATNPTGALSAGQDTLMVIRVRLRLRCLILPGIGGLVCRV